MLAQLKLSNLNEARKDTFRRVTDAISQLNAAADEAMKQQAYIRKDPDANGASELLPIIAPEFSATVAAFQTVAAKLQSMSEVHAGAKDIDQQIADYAIDLTAFSEELI